MQTPTHTTTAMADALDLSVRQVDFLIRNGTLPRHGVNLCGSGNKREWPTEVVVRLHVAKALYDAAPWMSWPTVAATVLDSDTLPPPKGLVVMRPDGTVLYVDNPLSLIGALADTGGVVADYRLPHAE